MKYLWYVLGFVVFLGVSFIFFEYYPFIFARTVSGTVLSVERVAPQSVITENKALAFSFAIAIKDEKTGEIFTASSEDRQMAAISKGYCARVKFFPYPPWDIEKADTYHDARLLKMMECVPSEGVALKP